MKRERERERNGSSTKWCGSSMRAVRNTPFAIRDGRHSTLVLSTTYAIFLIDDRHSTRAIVS